MLDPSLFRVGNNARPNSLGFGGHIRPKNLRFDVFARPKQTTNKQRIIMHFSC